MASLKDQHEAVIRKLNAVREQAGALGMFRTSHLADAAKLAAIAEFTVFVRQEARRPPRRARRAAKQSVVNE